MARPGVHYKDLQPVPDDERTDNTPATFLNYRGSKATHAFGQKPTASHELAAVSHDNKGAAQLGHDEDVIDLGWHEDEKLRPKPLVGGLPNDELWVLIRRFNKVENAHFAYRRPTMADGFILANVPCQRISVPSARKS